jgi:hypothetical protein
MKPLYYIAVMVAILALRVPANAQNINWKTLEPSQKHIINLNVGFDNASTVGVGYGYHMNTKMPLILNLEYSTPLGEKSLDDFKTKIGGQLNIVRANHLFVAVKAYGIIRRFENDFVRMVNFGSEFSGTAGFYKKRWYTAAEFGFDKAIVTHVKHSNLMKEYNPGLVTGWYIPTGGNALYGVQAGYSFNASEIYAKAGRTVTQDFRTAPLVPYYFQLGWNLKW